MAQIFHRSANTLSRVTIFGAVFIAGFVLWVIGGIVRSPYFTNQGNALEQVISQAKALDMAKVHAEMASQQEQKSDRA